ncbi:homogentisate 1,2-dioxygenase [Phaeacidiphilus oryzae]|uniref:homogentisate 1,2-dioxygenase n=1 Tax=Phaeacidiphilus oryzae TaxID=348818 RepID=UPI00068D43C0|nr:homogentisate 1,2-dioxygenase domain-containing protein [Phaeacidiphilus oryzae]
MAYYRITGSVPHKRHTQHRDEQGRLYYEELMGEEGFASDSSLLYHRSLPSAMTDSRVWPLPSAAAKTEPNHPLKPYHLRLHQLFRGEAWRQADAVRDRRTVLGNADVRLGYAAAGLPSPLYRNALGDELAYVESGAGLLETVFGTIEAGPGDYLLLPRATTHRWVPRGGEPLRLFFVEANSHISPARRYLSRFGQFLEHAPYCERDLRGPEGPLLRSSEEGDVEVYVKHRVAGGVGGSVLSVPHHPFDVVGWDGCLYPYALNISDFEPLTGRVHQPPPQHQVFEAQGLVVCNFVPRKVDYHPDSIPVPYYHSNVDSDEVLFYCGGDYSARKGSGIGQGSVSLHPGGHTHGPQPGAYERSVGVHFFDELAVMVDTFRPLELGEAAGECDDGRYAWSWSGRGPQGPIGPAAGGGGAE